MSWEKNANGWLIDICWGMCKPWNSGNVKHVSLRHLYFFPSWSTVTVFGQNPMYIIIYIYPDYDIAHENDKEPTSIQTNAHLV